MGAKETAREHRRKDELMIAQLSKCYYCKCLMSRRNKNTPNTATIEHLYPRGDIRRFVIKNNDCIVLACFKCNQEMNERFRGGENRSFVNLISILKTGRITVCISPTITQVKDRFELSSRKDAVTLYRDIMGDVFDRNINDTPYI